MTTFTRNTFLKAWVAALRSGDYHQCRGKMQEGGGHCCLSVAREVAREAGMREAVEDCSKYAPNPWFYELLQAGSSPITYTPHRSHEGLRSSFSDLNDHFGLTFDQIADLIEEQLIEEEAGG